MITMLSEIIILLGVASFIKWNLDLAAVDEPAADFNHAIVLEFVKTPPLAGEDDHGLADIEEDFTVQSRRTAPGEGIPVDMFPLDDNVPYKKISVLVSPGTGLIERISIHHKLGNTTTITFDDIKTGVKLKDRLFEWDIPEGTEIIEP